MSFENSTEVAQVGADCTSSVDVDTTDCSTNNLNVVQKNKAIERVTSWGAHAIPCYPLQPSTSKKGEKPDTKAPRRRADNGQIYRIPVTEYIDPAWMEDSEAVGYAVPDGHILIDLDRKHFTSDQACIDARDTLIAENNLGNAPLSRTLNGGWHVGPVAVESLPEYENFGIDGNTHVGELRGPGAFVIEAGPGYNQIQAGEIVSVDKLAGVIPTKQSEAPKAESSTQAAPVTAPSIARDHGRYLSLDALILKKLKPLLRGEVEADASAELKIFYQECIAWHRICTESGIATDDPKALYLQAVEACDRSKKAEAIIAKVEPTQCQASLENSRGLGYCKSRVKKLVSKKQEIASKDKAESEKLKKLEPHKLVDFCLDEFPELHYNVWSREIVFNDSRYDSDDSDHSDFYLVLATEYGIKASKEAAIDALFFAAKKRRRDPVLDYLEACKKDVEPLSDDDWQQIDKLLLGRSTSDPVEAMMIRKWAIGAIARAYDPGCKVDEMLVLCGAQGLKKSSFFRGLGGDFSCDSLGSLDNIKDDMITLHTYWLHEWGELDRITGFKEAGKVKHFCTKNIDSFRPPYGRKNQTFKRRSIIGATVNGDEFLRDPTGNRRFAVIDVSSPIDIAAVTRLRDALWAKAISEYESGVKWWYEGDEDTALRDKAERFTDTDVWEGRVEDYLQGKTETTIDAILLGCLGLDIGKQDRKHQIRLSKVMKRLGWDKKRVMRDGVRCRLWVKQISLVDALKRVSVAADYTAIQADHSQDEINTAWAQLDTAEQNRIVAIVEPPKAAEPAPKAVAEPATAKPAQAEPATAVEPDANAIRAKQQHIRGCSDVAGMKGLINDYGLDFVTQTIDASQPAVRMKLNTLLKKAN